MKLFYAPLACSMATRIALEELGRSAEYIPIDAVTRRAPDGSEIHPLGMVPVLRTDHGQLLTENAAILQYVAAGTELVPADPWGHAQLQRWLSFIGTELHKVVFYPLLDRKANDGARTYALDSAAPRLSLVATHLASREHLLDRYSVADIYLVTILNWAQATPIRLDAYPPLVAFLDRMKRRPAVAHSLALETELYLRERQRLPASPPSTRALLEAFNDVFQRHDPRALDTLVADDCIIDNTDGTRHTGKAACVALWTQIATNRALSFDIDEVRADSNHGVLRWLLREDGRPIVRGINLMLVRDGKFVHARGFTQPVTPP